MACALPVFPKRGTELKDQSKKTERTNHVAEFYPETNRPLIRPEIHWWKVAVIAAAVLIADIFGTCGVLYLLPQFAWYERIGMAVGWQFFIIFTVLCLVSIVILAKQIVIFTIRVYQRYASYDIRSSCVFIPNCSEYMILAIKKYGLISGIKRGFDRLNRCHPPNGGEDYP